MSDISIGTGIDQLMFGRDRHINRKIATEISDRVPTQNQAAEKQQEAEQVKSARTRHGYSWEEPDHLDPKPETNNDDCPKKNKRAAVTGNSLRLRAPSQREIKLRKTVDRRQDLWIRQSHRLLQKT